ncbi:MAG: hypothetical protein RIC55_08005 [Pirellulaceae bacterium]
MAQSVKRNRSTAYSAQLPPMMRAEELMATLTAPRADVAPMVATLPRPIPTMQTRTRANRQATLGERINRAGVNPAELLGGMPGNMEYARPGLTPQMPTNSIGAAGVIPLTPKPVEFSRSQADPGTMGTIPYTANIERAGAMGSGMRGVEATYPSTITPLPQLNMERSETPLPRDTETSRTLPASYVQDIIKPVLERNQQQAQAARDAEDADLNAWAMMSAKNKALLPAANALGVPVSLGYTRYDEGKQKMRENMLAEEKGITERLIANEQGTHFQGARPVTMPNGRVQWIKGGERQPLDGERLAAANAAILEKGYEYDAQTGGFRPKGLKAPSGPESHAPRDLVAEATERKTKRLLEGRQRVADARKTKSELMQQMFDRARINRLAWQNPEVATAMIAASTAADDRAANREFRQMALSSEVMQRAADRELQQQQLGIQREYNAGRLSAEQAQLALQSLTAQRDADYKEQELRLTTNPGIIAHRAAEGAVAAGLPYGPAYREAFKAAAAGQQYGDQTSGEPGTRPLPIPPELATSDTTIPAATQQIDQQGGEGTADWLAGLAEEMSTPTRNLGLSEMGVLFGYPGAWPNRRAAYLASGILRGYQQGKFSDTDAEMVKQVLLSRMDPSFISQLNNPKTEDTADVRLLRAVLSGKPISSVGLTPAEVQEIIDTSRFTWLGSPS